MSHEAIMIARQFGSRNHEVAQRLPDQLGVPLYDRNLVEMAAERAGHPPVSIEKADESVLPSFPAGYQIPEEPNSVTGYELSLNDSTYVAQTIIIEILAQKGPCVIVGRCGDYMLRSHPSLIDVFICADTEDRVRRIMDRYSFSERSTVNTIKSTDYRHKSYYKSYVKRKWGSIESHQVLLSTSKLGMDETVRIIKGIYEVPQACF